MLGEIFIQKNDNFSTKNKKVLVYSDEFGN